MKKLLILCILLLPLIAYSASVGFSGPGSIYLGTIQLNKVYDVATILGINTGSEYGCFKTNVAYHQDQPEYRVPAEWVIFTPDYFCLEAGKTQLIDIKLYPKRINGKVQYGDYFSYLEICTANESSTGVSIGACAATKLYFTLEKTSWIKQTLKLLKWNF